jgi:hypothetical protein
MPKAIWRLVNVWFWKETIRGTWVAVSTWLPKTSLSFQDKTENIQDESSIWVIVDQSNSFVSKKYAEWWIEWNININSFWFLLLSAIWNVSSAVDTTWAYKHTFTLANNNQNQSLTIWVDDPIGWDYQFALAMLDKLTISWEVWGIVNFKAEFKSKQSWSTTHTVTYVTDYTLLARHLVFKTANNLAWLSWATQKSIKSFEIVISKNLEEDYSISSNEPRDFINKEFSIDWSVTAVYEDPADYITIAKNGTKQALRFDIVDSNTVIWLTSNPSLRLDLAKCMLQDYTVNYWNKEVLTQDIKFKAEYSLADAQVLACYLINTKVSY